MKYTAELQCVISNMLSYVLTALTFSLMAMLILIMQKY